MSAPPGNYPNSGDHAYGDAAYARDNPGKSPGQHDDEPVFVRPSDTDIKQWRTNKKTPNK